MPAGQQPKIDLGKLESGIAQLQKTLAFVGQNPTTDSSDLFTIIHHPGWTTVVQVELAQSLIDTMNQQAVALRGLRNVLQTHVNESTGRG
jgi:hypothetical protein